MSMYFIPIKTGSDVTDIQRTVACNYVFRPKVLQNYAKTVFCRIEL